MRILSTLSIILIAILSLNSPILAFASENVTSEAFEAIKQKKWEKAYGLASKSGDPILKKIVLSQRYLDSSCDKNTFEEIAKFLLANPDWPQSYLLKLRAESCINADTDKKLIVSWFSKNPPITAKGYKYYALSADDIINDKEKLSDIIKKAWHNGNFSLADQKSYNKRFANYLTLADHVKKIDNHLWNSELSAAENSLYLVNPNYKKSFYAQISLIKGEKNANTLFKNIEKKYYTAGLVYRYIESNKRNLLNSAEIVNVINSIATEANKEYGDKFWKIQSYIAREFIEKKKYSDAYKVVSAHFTTSASDKSDAEYLAGWLALQFLKKPQIALKHFNNFNNIVETPMSKSRGIYWLARAHEASSDKEKANNLYNIAASKYSNTFYGQVAAMRMGRNKIILPESPDLSSYSQSGAKYASRNDATSAMKLILKYGNNGLILAYINSIVGSAKTESDVMNLAYNIQQSKNVHHMAWMAKKALQKNVFIKNAAYPVPYKIQQMPIETPLIYSIIRQESVFDQYAVSSAEARGLMQLIESTACQVAKKIETKCSIAKLTTDTTYNIKLGSNYLNQMIQEYNGSYILAIAAYNAGPHNVNKWLQIYGDPRTMKNPRDVLDWLEHIPFYETRNYVQRVLENLQIYRTIIDEKSRFALSNDLLSK